MFESNSDIKRFKRAIKQAMKMDWRLSEAKAKSLTELAVRLGYIDGSRVRKLQNKLEHGEVFLREDGEWACITCGGNCGQCGDTAFYGNVGFSVQHIVNRIEGGRIQRKSKLKAFLERQVRLVLFILIWIIWLGFIALVSWEVSKRMYG